MRRPVCLSWFVAPMLGLAVAAAPAAAVPLDLMSAEASAFLQSWVGTEGTGTDGVPTDPVDPTAFPVPQPGTVGFRPFRGPIATRVVDGRIVVLPGGRGPDVPYDPEEEGDPQLFSGEISALSWNALMARVALSTPADPANVGVDEFDPSLPFRPDGCSFANPIGCSAVAEFWSGSRVEWRWDRFDFELPDGGAAAVPEPGAALLFAAGFALVGARVARRR